MNAQSVIIVSCGRVVVVVRILLRDDCFNLREMQI